MRIRRTPLLALVLAVLLGGVVNGPARAATVWSYNTYHSAGYMTQNPYLTECTAAATMMMLNFTALSGSGRNGFIWTPSTAQLRTGDPRDMTSIFAFARANDTLSPAGVGSDPHGWRNALNSFGWGAHALTPDVRVYDDRAYRGFDEALRAAVTAIARYRKPVGMLAWAGRHAQIITGYSVVGENPALSPNFTVNALYVSDPLAADRIVNRLISATALRTGSLTYRFRPYAETDSPYDDPYTPGFIPSSTRSGRSEWFARWILILPIRDGLPST